MVSGKAWDKALREFYIKYRERKVKDIRRKRSFRPGFAVPGIEESDQYEEEEITERSDDDELF